jgi:hypothetical protein
MVMLTTAQVSTSHTTALTVRKVEADVGKALGGVEHGLDGLLLDTAGHELAGGVSPKHTGEVDGVARHDEVVDDGVGCGEREPRLLHTLGAVGGLDMNLVRVRGVRHCVGVCV